MAVRIVTDSASSVGDADLRRLSIQMVPLHVHVDGHVVPEPELRQPAFYMRLAEMSALPTTSQPSPDEFRTVFEDVLADGHDVLAVLISAGMSGTVQSAVMAAAALLADHPEARIDVLDSASNSLEQGFAVLSAAEAAASGALPDECRRAATETMRRTRFLFAPRSLEYLRRGGRISGASALLSVMLKIVPILTATNGHTGVAGVARTGRSARTRIAAFMRRDVEDHGLRRAAVQYVADEREATRFAVEVIEPIVGGPVPVVAIHPVVGLHVGPAIGVVYETEEPLR